MAASLPPIRIDLVSDTATRPGAAMRQAMANADVGDEQRGEDPSVNALISRVADLLGQEAAMFLPSGTMCNQIALTTHCRPGDAVIAAANSHIITSEGAGVAVFAQSVIEPIATGNGIFTAEEMLQHIRSRGTKAPRTRLVSNEQTSNRGGGSVWPLDSLHEVADAARQNGLLMHMDGARLMNAVVAAGVEARRFAAPFDSVWLDLSKGLGCPMGGLLAGSAAFIEEAMIWKHRFGGAMRQAGIVAAAGLFALDNNVARLARDHANARDFVKQIRGLPGVRILNPAVESNLVCESRSETGHRNRSDGLTVAE